MARPRYPRHEGPLPPPLPPETRTVGQLVAETIRLYGRSFLYALPLGLVVAVADQLQLDRTVGERVVLLAALAPAFTLAYAAGVTIALDVRPPARVWVNALVVGVLAFLPAAFFFPWFTLAAVLWLGLVSNAVPAAMVEGLGPAAAVRRAFALARADYVHAAGSLATLALLFGLTRLALGFVLRAQADNTIRVSIFLADVVLAPALFIGAALLYVDQAARVTSRRDRRRRKDAPVPDALEADREGHADPELESRPSA